MRIVIIYHNADLPAAAGEDDYKGRRQNRHIREISRALESLGHQVIKVRANHRMFGKLLRLKNKIDLAFNLADEGYEFDTRLEPHVPALLDIFGIPYTGSDYLCLGICLDKVRTKQILIANRLPTPKFIVFEHPIKPSFPFNLKFPVIIKPSRQDGSIGIRKDSVTDRKRDMVAKVNTIIRKYRQAALVEEFIDGREVNVGIIGNTQLEILPISEIIFRLPKHERKFLWYETKWERRSRDYKRTTPQCPADLGIRLKRKIIDMAVKAYRLMGVSCYGRIDFRIDDKERLYILEVNPNPDTSYEAGLARMGRAAGWDYPQLLQRIIDVSIKS